MTVVAEDGDSSISNTISYSLSDVSQCKAQSGNSLSVLHLRPRLLHSEGQRAVGQGECRHQ